MLIATAWLSSRLLQTITSKQVSRLDAAHSPSRGVEFRGANADADADAEATRDALPVELPSFKPLLFPCDISHRRFYPIKHDFKYSRLFVGIPVLHEPVNDNSLLSSHPASQSQTRLGLDRGKASTKSAWLSVDAAEFLQRGPAFHNLSLREKLDLYLLSRNIADPRKSFPYAYLVTAPNFLGQSLNQVCFWYLYDMNKALSAVMFEVNSTFDERRIFFARSGQVTQEQNSDATSTSSRFAAVFEKDFHVSPFLERDGTYSTKVTDVVRTGRVDITIVLTPNSKCGPGSGSIDSAKPILVSRLFSAPGTPGIDPNHLSTYQKLLVLLRYPWSSFLTLPRVLIQARNLWAKGLQVYYRPEPLNTTIPRTETREECIIEQCFRKVLANLAQQAKIGVQYAPAAGLYRGQTISIGQDEHLHQNGQGGMPTLQLRITTPAFYSELVKMQDGKGSLQHAFGRLCFEAEEKDSMAECSSAATLHAILSSDVSSKPVSSTSKEDNSSQQTRFHAINEGNSVGTVRANLWKLMELVRSPSWESFAAFLYSHCQSSSSELNQQIRTVYTAEEYKEYCHAAFMVLIANKVAFGDAWILSYELSILRMIIVLVTTVPLVSFIGRVDWDITLLQPFADWICGF